MTTRVAPPTHYHVYVIELDREICRRRRHECTCRDDKPPVYVGATSLTPEARFTKHKAGEKASKDVRDYGLRLRPRLSRAYGPYATWDEASAAEKRLAARLERRGFCVFGGT